MKTPYEISHREFFVFYMGDERAFFQTSDKLEFIFQMFYRIQDIL